MDGGPLIDELPCCIAAILDHALELIVVDACNNKQCRACMIPDQVWLVEVAHDVIQRPDRFGSAPGNEYLPDLVVVIADPDFIAASIGISDDGQQLILIKGDQRIIYLFRFFLVALMEFLLIHLLNILNPAEPLSLL